MAEAAKKREPRLMPMPKTLEKALLQFAQQARKMAKAFGLEVPAVADKPRRAPMGRA
jgi:hypothetical protein